MLKIGSKVIVISLPPEWGIPEQYIGTMGVVISISRRSIGVMFVDNGNIWSFPTEYEGILQLYVENKWNPMNYKPRLEPMKLP